MQPDKFDECLKTLMSMCLDCMRGGITRSTFVSNLKTFLQFFEENKEGKDEA